VFSSPLSAWRVLLIDSTPAQVQRHAVFKILDLESEIATMTDHERSQAPPNYSRIQLLRETATFPMPIVSLSVADYAPESQWLNFPAFHALNRERDKCMRYFIMAAAATTSITNKFRKKIIHIDCILPYVGHERNNFLTFAHAAT
jgi:hypothetical protein